MKTEQGQPRKMTFAELLDGAFLDDESSDDHLLDHFEAVGAKDYLDVASEARRAVVPLMLFDVVEEFPDGVEEGSKYGDFLHAIACESASTVLRQLAEVLGSDEATLAGVLVDGVGTDPEARFGELVEASDRLLALRDRLSKSTTKRLDALRGREP